MEWLLVNPHLHNIFASLGCQVGDQYVAHPNCQVTLDHIIMKLCQEDRTLRTFRRAIVFSNLIKKDLLQLLIAKKDDRVIIDKTLKLFVELTTPVDNLLPVDVMSKTDAGRTTVIELNWLLYSAKEAFLEPKATHRVLEIIRMLLDAGVERNSKNEDTLTDCVALLRNILDVPESRPTSKGNATSYQNILICNLFSQNVGQVLINLATRHQNGNWKIGVVQIILILYKDQQEITLQKLLHQWLESTVISESSEDNESNTSPPDYSSTSDPTSDSSDNSGSEKHIIAVKCSLSHHKKMQTTTRKSFNSRQAHKKVDSDWEMTQYQHRGSNDSGCDTMVEHRESVSTSSNDESPERKVKPVHVKPGNMMHKQRPANKQPLTLQELRILKMKKLQRRAKNNASLNGGSVLCNLTMNHHNNPSNEDIALILKEFTVDFLISAYACLVEDLRRQVVDSRGDSSQFSWLITYFLKFAIQLELDYESIRPILSKDVVTFLVFQGVYLCELYEDSRLQADSDFDMAARLRKQHLVVTALRELLLAMTSYLNVTYISKESSQQVRQLQRDICGMEDLRNLFVLMLRQYNPDVHCRSYLIDLICTNHILIDSIDKCQFLDGKALLLVHLKQFTAADIMKQYGILLGFYSENSPIINDCIFNMMHHVAGDLDSLNSLLQPSIIRAFTLIYETEGSQLMEDWSDLIEYVIHQFMASTKKVKPPVKPTLPELANPSPLVNRQWSREDCDALFWYFVQSANSSDPVGSIMQLYSDSGVQNKTRIRLIEQLLKQDIISDTQFNELMAKEPIETIQKEMSSTNIRKEIDHLKDQLLNEGMEPLIGWLQREVLKACHARLSLFHETESPVEAAPLYYALRDETIPLVPWSCEQFSAMQNHIFLMFLHKLGFLLPADTGHSFARIPKTWSLPFMFKLAQQLGDFPEEWIKFDPADLTKFEHPGIPLS